MAKFKNLLFPIDFSPSCEDVVPHVLAMAERFRSRITTLNVLDFPRARYIGLNPSLLWPEAEMDQMKQRQRQTLETFVRERLPYADVHPMVHEGEPAHAITAVAGRDASDLVMMPTRGMGPFRRYLIGSVTAKVLYDCPCPVWTSAHKEQRTQPQPIPDGAVLCAINLEPESVPLLQWSAQFSTSWSTTLRVLHVVPAVEEESQNRGVAAVRKYLFDKAREKWKGIQSSANVDADLCLAGGDISQAVASAAEKERTSVIVIARGRMQKPLGGLRTQAYAIIRESPCPVIAI